MYFKNPKIESEKIKEYARGRSCTLRIPGICEDNGRNTCACHVNSNIKGVSNKSPDIFTVIGCHACHHWIDEGYAGKVSKAERDQEILRALLETLMIYIKAGLVLIK